MTQEGSFFLKLFAQMYSRPTIKYSGSESIILSKNLGISPLRTFQNLDW